MAKQQLMVFTRYPIPGETKTRLIPALGKVGAAQLQQELTEYALQQLALLKDVDITIYFSGGSLDQVQDWLGRQWTYQSQQGETLGDRLLTGFQQSEKNGYECTVAIGIDCPSLTPNILESAFVQLQEKPVVLGPALDGGYYLIGLQRSWPELFNAMPWGTAQVFSETQARVRALGLSSALLPSLPDIDLPEDLGIWDRLKRASSSGVLPDCHSRPQTD